MLSKQIEHTFGVGGLGRFFFRAGTGLLYVGIPLSSMSARRARRLCAMAIIRTNSLFVKQNSPKVPMPFDFRVPQIMSL
tara:strand:+ start:597 stop:833 length:237 start_codon:yes stop_codon:yes gene_type:complete